MAIEHGDIIIDDPALAKPFAVVPGVILESSQLSQGSKLAYAMLIMYSYKYNGYPGHEQMGKDLGVSGRSIQTYLGELRSQGLIEVGRRGLGETNTYRLLPLSETDFWSDQKRASDQTRNELPVKNKDNTFVNTNNENGDASPSEVNLNDKQQLIAGLALEFAPRENPSAIQTLLAPFATGHLLTAAEITRNNSEIEKPIAYLLGTVRNLSEAESYLPAAQRQAPELPELTEAEYQASLEALARVRARQKTVK